MNAVQRNFRNRGIKPLVGDDVEISVLDEEKATGNLMRSFLVKTV